MDIILSVHMTTMLSTVFSSDIISSPDTYGT